MREHFFQCLMKEEIKPFPSTIVRAKQSATTKQVQLHCDCCLPENGEEPMAQCSKCKKWYHKNCQAISDLIFVVNTKRAGFVIIVWLCN